MLAFVIVMFAFGICEYRRTASSIEATQTSDFTQQGRKHAYDADATHFAELTGRYRDSGLPLLHRACIGLRTQWLLGGTL